MWTPAPSSCSLPQHPPKPRSAPGVSAGRGAAAPGMSLSSCLGCPSPPPALAAACPCHPPVPTGMLRLQQRKGHSRAAGPVGRALAITLASPRCSPPAWRGPVWDRRRLLVPAVLAVPSEQAPGAAAAGAVLRAWSFQPSFACPACVLPPSPLTPCLLSLPVFLSVNNLPQTPSTFTITTCHILHPTTAITMVTPR